MLAMTTHFGPSLVSEVPYLNDLLYRRTDLIQNSLFVCRVYQNDWSGLEVDHIHKYGEQNYKF